MLDLSTGVYNPGVETSRADLFATIEQPHLRLLPPHPYEFARWERARIFEALAIANPRHTSKGSSERRTCEVLFLTAVKNGE